MLKTVELTVLYETYPESKLVESTFSGETEKDALLEMLKTVYMYLSSKGAEELTVNEIIEELTYQNGNGCDFIYSIQNASNGKTYFDYSNVKDSSYA